ncbi:endothelin-converting enzyme/putative endopeptidase [Christiangramia gaetbulicola]|uniref:Endothelin-converting enzyme/putative endopeptidase n=1 Tax=Christiangramia gaetbulicola TaxID=703340 RepID=A0A2T6AN49_9FLAO|nr:M13 family metallopeptidase [Christiangramia gaetbulicola]PTX45242.1 endothelin-converting enzyme/putative endopeptidase [Christiangramia gaetbulicola]
MKKINRILFVSALGAGLLTACNDDKKVEEKEEIHGINLAYMDTTTTPQEDFFRYVNGAWLDSTEIPNDRTRWGSFDELRQRTDEDALALLEKTAESDSLDGSTDQGKAVFLYKSIMDTVTRNKQGVEPVKPYLAKIDKIQSKEDLQAFLVEMSEYGSAGFFSFGVGADSKNSDMNAAYLNPSGLGLPERDYYLLDDADSKDTRKKYKEYITDMLQYLDYTEADAKKAAETILAFETRLAEPRLDKVERRDARKTYNPMTVAELQKITPAMQWNSYFEGIGAKDLDTIIVSQPEYMKALQDLLAENSVEDWKTYLKWDLFNSAASSLSTDLEKESWEFYSKTLRGAKEQRPRNERALSTINGVLGEALGKLYVEKHFPPQAKETAKEMVDNILKAYENRINNLSWMSEDTKKKALEKLGTFNVKIGYPDTWKDYSELEIQSPEEGGSYFQNMLNAQKWRVAENMADLGEPVDKTEWFMSPQTVNAYYNPRYNEIVFPAAILQPPFYDYKADAAVNYGGIGAVIGHEISHGFDDSGARFDAEGNLNNWWTEKDLEQFEGLGSELAEQYSAIEVLDSVYINGKFTLGENIGDLGGVNAAYDGLQIHLNENGNPGEIDGFTPEQRFFLSWATVWRTKMREEALRNRIKTDSHSPGMYRAYVPLQNIDAWYDAFVIKEGDPMYVKPEERVRIW